MSELDEASADSFPASDPIAFGNTSSPAGRPRTPDTDCVEGEWLSTAVVVELSDGTRTEVDNGHVVIAAITSCTNTSTRR